MARLREISTGEITWRVRYRWEAYRRFQDALAQALDEYRSTVRDIKRDDDLDRDERELALLAAQRDYERAQEAAGIDLICEVVVDWDGAVDDGGQPIPWSREALDGIDAWEVSQLLRLLAAPAVEPPNPTKPEPNGGRR